eukprot:Rhum_TRINITY_DN5018_c0_g1::Rhum_TRINITY_DN5018_c0_g1_i1::g.16343::m.16343
MVFPLSPPHRALQRRQAHDKRFLRANRLRPLVGQRVDPRVEHVLRGAVLQRRVTRNRVLQALRTSQNQQRPAERRREALPGLLLGQVLTALGRANHEVVPVVVPDRLRQRRRRAHVEPPVLAALTHLRHRHRHTRERLALRVAVAGLVERHLQRHPRPERDLHRHRHLLPDADLNLVRPVRTRGHRGGSRRRLRSHLRLQLRRELRLLCRAGLRRVRRRRRRLLRRCCLLRRRLGRKRLRLGLRGCGDGGCLLGDDGALAVEADVVGERVGRDHEGRHGAAVTDVVVQREEHLLQVLWALRHHQVACHEGGVALERPVLREQDVRGRLP